MEISQPSVTSEPNPPSVSVTYGRDSPSPLLTLKVKEKEVAAGNLSGWNSGSLRVLCLKHSQSEIVALTARVL